MLNVLKCDESFLCLLTALTIVNSLMRFYTETELAEDDHQHENIKIKNNSPKKQQHEYGCQKIKSTESQTSKRTVLSNCVSNHELDTELQKPEDETKTKDRSTPT